MALHGGINLRDKVTTKDAQIAVTQNAAHPVGAKAADAPAPAVDDPHLGDIVTGPPQLRDQLHSFSDPEPDTPEIHDVAAGAQERRSFDHRRSKAEP